MCFAPQRRICPAGSAPAACEVAAPWPLEVLELVPRLPPWTLGDRRQNVQSVLYPTSPALPAPAGGRALCSGTASRTSRLLCSLWDLKRDCRWSESFAVMFMAGLRADGDSDSISARIFVILMVLHYLGFCIYVYLYFEHMHIHIVLLFLFHVVLVAVTFSLLLHLAFWQEPPRPAAVAPPAPLRRVRRKRPQQEIGQATFNWVTPQHERLAETGSALVKYCDNVSILSRQPDGNIEFDHIGTYRHTKMHVHQSPRRSPQMYIHIFAYFGVYITVRQPDGNLEFNDMHTSTYTYTSINVHAYWEMYLPFLFTYRHR